VPLENAFLHISDLSIQRGYGVFDFFKVSNGHPLFLNDYLERFYHSASVMRLEVPHTPNELRSIIYRLIEKNNLPESGIKMILTGGYSADGYQPRGSSLIITQQLLTLPAKDLIEKGIKVITYDYVRDFPHAKTINYTMGIWLTKLVADNNAADVLYQKNNVVSEFPRCNFFMVRKDGVVVTPGDNILYGVTRKQVLELSKRYYQSREGEITLDDIYNASEAFLTSTTKRIVPIVQVNSVTIGEGKPGPVTLALLDHLTALENAD
jgi:branched-chain amino acid aminotransferase